MPLPPPWGRCRPGGNFTGKMTISANADFMATNSLPTGGCWSFNSGLTGTGENSNAVYSELPAASSQTFAQYFSV
jgi:hypothetical protein